MSTIKFAKVATLPATLAPSTLYLMAPAGSSIDELQIYVSSNDGLSSRHIPTHNEIATMISTAANSYSSAVVVADIAALTAAVAQIQALLDADEGTEGFQLGQNIVTALTNLTSRVTTLENSDVVAQLQSMVNSLGTDLANETNRAQATEANLQGQIDALTSDLAALEAVVANSNRRLFGQL